MLGILLHCLAEEESTLSHGPPSMYNSAASCVDSICSDSTGGDSTDGDLNTLFAIQELTEYLVMRKASGGLTRMVSYLYQGSPRDSKLDLEPSGSVCVAI